MCVCYCRIRWEIGIEEGEVMGDEMCAEDLLSINISTSTCTCAGFTDDAAEATYNLRRWDCSFVCVCVAFFVSGGGVWRLDGSGNKCEKTILYRWVSFLLFMTMY